MGKARITVAGIGPGSEADITPAVIKSIGEADVVVGYKYYFRFIEKYVKEGCRCIDTGMKRERDRAQQAFDMAMQGQHVVVISSGDAAIYGMTPLIYEMKRRYADADIEIVSLPGISAFQKAASLLGAPVGHDFCVISLSDLMTPWATIEKRITAAAEADFVTAVYNPKSNGRYWQLYRLQEIFLMHRDPKTPVGYVRQAGRPEEEVFQTTLGEFDPEQIDMFTVVIIGNSQSYCHGGSMITPRGYYREENTEGDGGNKEVGVGQEIMMESFRTIRSEMSNPDAPLYRLWPLLHAIHTSADFAMEDIIYTTEEAVPRMFGEIEKGRLNTIVTDVTMAAAGIRKAACSRMGIEVKCYLADPRVAEMAKKKGITRSQAGIRLAVEEHPDALFVFGNAPTALIELCSLMRQDKAKPAGIIAAPVGFVHVCESKHMVKVFRDVPKIIVEGRKGGSNLAATLVNSILAWDDAQQLMPGRDV
ncbi:MAG: precorrin-3B C(17)-methyltransferase [Prevotella sp.]|uniref:precorrin-3B C(17)-methyltransferase n=1 Tax=Prevotella sp. TaxID=59823 RepID=UPI002A2E992E|nr:precorrin-3B C(17)-methyltransferase [Prevotella sp.]MDD7318968.1 precorrin-3B C(17)-methyltransferase [Prevotellaceae bacterium]MDY4019994.1 precorrin-3B C(17)-methyltransferase [Prevotella sp.]